MIRRPRTVLARMRFTNQVRWLMACLITGLLAGALWFSSWELRRHLSTFEMQRALAVAEATESDPDLAHAVQRHDLVAVQNTARRVEQRTGALFVVITDRNGVRLAHPNPDRVGERVSTDPAEVLAGRKVANIEHGTLGLSVRGKVPLRNQGGDIVGEVSVGFDANDLNDRVNSMLLRALPGALVAVALGWAGTEAIVRLLKRKTHGLEPGELTELVREREAVLHSIDEGLLAFDPQLRITASNQRAQGLLGQPLTVGTSLADIQLPARVRATLAWEEHTNELAVAGPRMLVFSVRRVRRDGRDLGGVISLRDRTDFEALVRERDSVRLMTTSLRAQRHEYANRLQTLSGLLSCGATDEAREYLSGVAAADEAAETFRTASIESATIRAFLSAKTAQAAERDVSLTVSQHTYLPGKLLAPAEVITVLGNLVDNAIDAAADSDHRPRLVEIDLVAEGLTLLLFVADSGDGVSDERAETIFREGVSGRGQERGFGLALARKVAESLGGEVALATTANPGQPLPGAVFRARLPEVLRSTA